MLEVSSNLNDSDFTGLKGISRGHLVWSPCIKQEHLQLHKVAQSPIKHDLKYLQGWGLHLHSEELVWVWKTWLGFHSLFPRYPCSVLFYSLSRWRGSFCVAVQHEASGILVLESSGCLLCAQILLLHGVNSSEDARWGSSHHGMTLNCSGGSLCV